MSKEEDLKKSQLPDMHPMGPGDPTNNEPVPDDSWYIESNPLFRGADIVGVNYKAMSTACRLAARSAPARRHSRSRRV